MTIPKEEIYTFKILIFGDTSSGKAQFISSFCEDNFKEDTLTTIGLDTKTKYVKKGDKKIQLIIWDSAGQERFRSIAKNACRGTDGIILVYDISNIRTFNHIRDFLNSIKENIDISKIGIIIVGNKCDKSDSDRVVDEEMKNNFEIRNNIKIYEASAKDNINVTECFNVLIDKMIELGLGKKRKIYDDNDDDNEIEDGNEHKLKVEGKKRNNNCFGGRAKKK